MSQNDKKFDSIASILNSIDNLANKFLEYQSDKKDEAREFARKIDRLTFLAKQRERRKKKKEEPKTDEEKKERAKELKEEQEFDNFLIDTLTIVDGILSSPAGNDREFLIASTTYLRQKSSEKNKELTSFYVQDVRDTYLVRIAIDVKTWDMEFRQMMQKSMAMVQNIALAFRGEKQDDKPPQVVAKEITKNENKSEKYELN